MNNHNESENVIIDVRTPEEYKAGHAVGSVNIPFSVIPLRLDEIRSFNKKPVICCQSGARSRVATRLLKSEGIECQDVGSWMNLNAQAGGLN